MRIHLQEHVYLDAPFNDNIGLILRTTDVKLFVQDHKFGIIVRKNV